MEELGKIYLCIFSYATPNRKCSNEGRALMQLDVQQLAVKLEKLVDLRPIPHKSLVETYVKAYYMPETALEDWIVRHPVGHQFFCQNLGLKKCNFCDFSTVKIFKYSRLLLYRTGIGTKI